MNKTNNILSNLESNNEVDVSYTIGAVTLLIYSKEAFKNNKDIEPFLKEVFNVEYLPYVIQSRTLISARLGRELTIKESKEIKKINKKVLQYFDKDFPLNKSKKRQKKNANEKLDTWLKGF